MVVNERLGLAAGPVGGFMEPHGLKYRALEALDLLAGRRGREAYDLMLNLEEVEPPGVAVDEVVNLIDYDEVIWIVLEVESRVVVHKLVEAGHVEVVSEGLVVPLHKVFSRENEMDIGRLPLLQGMEAGCGDNPGLPLT